MRALLTILLVLSGGCDVWWASFIGTSSLAGDGGTSDTADLAVEDVPDLQLTGCLSDEMCGQNLRSCDRNTGKCVLIFKNSGPFPSNFETSIPLSKRYVLLASGDYNGDQVADIAVSGLFAGVLDSANAVTGAVTDVEIYLGDGVGGLTFDGSCPVNDEVTYLLTVPGQGVGKYNPSDLLVATRGAKIYHCSRAAGGSWSILNSGTLSSGSGFKQLALANDAGVTFPDLVVRTSDKLFPDPNGSGSLVVQRMTPGYTITGVIAEFSASGISWATVTPYHFGAATADTLALSWVTQTSINFQYLSANLSVVDQGFANTPSSAGMPFGELGYPLRTTALFRVAGQAAPFMLHVASQSQNQVSLQYGTDVAGFALVDKMTAPANGIMLAYTGDAGEDGQDELGLYTIAPNTTAMTRNLQIFAYSGGLNATPVTDIALTSENFRGMAFAYLGNSGDRRRAFKRKDLITLVEDPVGSSRLIIRRANLNYYFPE